MQFNNPTIVPSSAQVSVELVNPTPLAVVDGGLKRLTVQKCRALIGRQHQLSDPDLLLLRDQMYSLADVALQVFLNERTQQSLSVAASTIN